MKKFRIYLWKDIKEDEMFKSVVKKKKARLNDYFTVMVFDTYEEMYNTVEKIENGCRDFKRNIERNYGGRMLVCRQKLEGADTGKHYGYSKANGFIFLCEEDGLTFDTVSHEVGHAVLGYFGAYFNSKFRLHTYSRKETEEDMLYEELFCYITGSLCNQICIRF